MIKVAIAIGLVFMIAALSVFGSPFFAILLLVPAAVLYLALAGASAAVEEEPGQPDPDSRPSKP